MDYDLIKLEKGAFFYLTSPGLLRERSIFIAFTGRRGGYSKKPYESLNLGFHTGDDCQTVLKNRKSLFKKLGLNPDKLTTGKQVHGSSIVEVNAENAGSGAYSYSQSLEETDGLLTQEKEIPLAVFTADCLPVVMAGKDPAKVAVLHCGWRGLASGILLKASASFEPSQTLVFLGPAIGECCYEVGKDVAGQLGEVCPADKCKVGLAKIAKKQLEEIGFEQNNIFDSDICTACSTEEYFSYRFEGTTGRQATLAVLK